MEEIKPKIITPFIFENITTQNLTFSYFLPGAARQTIAALHLGLFLAAAWWSQLKSIVLISVTFAGNLELFFM